MVWIEMGISIQHRGWRKSKDLDRDRNLGPAIRLGVSARQEGLGR